MSISISIFYVYSANSNYELGRGDKVGGWKPKPIPSLESTHIVQIASGGYHSLALTGKTSATCPFFSFCWYTIIIDYSFCIILDEGKVLSWGHGGHGQLGHSSIQNQKVPATIEALADKRVVYIACGGSSSAAITGMSCICFW